MNGTRVRAYFILLIYIVVVVLYHLFGYTGHFGFDDLHYAELARNLLRGSVDFEDHYAFRFSLILFTSLIYSIFGISDFASSLPALLITITILIIVFSRLRQQGNLVLMIGLSLATCSNWFLFYSDKLMPDIYVALSVLLALAIMERYKYKSRKTQTLLHSMLLALTLLFGFMAKGTIVLMLPLLIYLAVTDIILRRDLKFWLYSLISGVVLLALYLLVIGLLTGDLLKRFEAISSNSYLNPCSYDQQSTGVLLGRIFSGFFKLSVYQSVATGFIFIIASLFQKNAKRHFRLDDPFSFYLVSAVILFLSANFMTISPTSYSPMCLDPRHYLFLVPVASIPASKIIAGYVQTKQPAIQVLAVLFVVTITSFFLPGQTFWKLYLPLFLLFTAWYFTGITRRLRQLFVLLFAAILLLVPADMIRYARKVQYRKQKQIVVSHVLESNRDCIIITDEVQKRLLGYYSGFNEVQTRRFLSFDEYEADTTIGGEKRMLLNGYTRYLSGLEQNDLPYYARYISPLNRIVFENKEPELSLYEMKVFPLPALSGNPLFATFNDFEKRVPFWHQKEEDLTTRITYAGAKSNMVKEFSATLEYPLDSLHVEEMQNLLVHCNLYIYTEGKSSARIVVSLDNSEGNYLWEALEVGRYIKAYSNWWPVSYDVTIAQKDLKDGSRLKVYVWNRDNRPVYIDNMGIQILTPVP